ncbi:MAG TPA: DNA repair protein RadA [Acidimicrobiales bacterium]|nr:DNA repair protein RadA [Acidimicrobiales bacterium]
MVRKSRILYRCKDCGASQPRWSGRCGTCDQWNTLEEESAAFLSAGVRSTGAQAPACHAIALSELDVAGHRLWPTGLQELDRVLGGGLLAGSSTLLGGEPGTGKSTLLLQAMAAMACAGRRCLLVAAEEAAQQVARRAARLGADVPGVFAVEASDLQSVENAIAVLKPEVLVVDSIQAVCDPDIGSAPGSLPQVRGCAQSLVALGEAIGAALVLVGHVTKEGLLAGPRELEHLVDTVLTFEGDRYLALRALRAVKHRFGPTGEMGLFEMTEKGLTSVLDPSALFLGDRMKDSPGSAVTVAMAGHRPLLVEVQALVGRSSAVPRRSVSGLDPGRVAFLVAVLDRRAGILVGDCDLYVSVAGGARAQEPAADLAACLAIASSARGKPLASDLVAIGEVGLGGEVRRVSAVGKRLTEAARLGFSAALIPGSVPPNEAATILADSANPVVAASPSGPAACRTGVGLPRVLHSTTLTEALAIAFGDDVAAGSRAWRPGRPAVSRRGLGVRAVS